MAKQQSRHFKTSFIAGVVIILIGFGIYYIASLVNDSNASISLTPNDMSVIASGKVVYSENCASCHGAALEGQANWQQRDADGYMPAPPHDETGHTWHHPDSYLFLMTKYGIEKMIRKTYPNKMPAYEDQLTDDEILAALSYIKSTWPKRIQRQHDQINARAKAQ